MCIFYDIMNRFDETQDPIFIDAMFEFEEYYNRLLQIRRDQLMKEDAKQGIEELAEDAKPFAKLAYILRPDHLKTGFTQKTETDNPNLPNPSENQDTLQN